MRLATALGMATSWRSSSARRARATRRHVARILFGFGGERGQALVLHAAEHREFIPMRDPDELHLGRGAVSILVDLATVADRDDNNRCRGLGEDHAPVADAETGALAPTKGLYVADSRLRRGDRAAAVVGTATVSVGRCSCQARYRTSWLETVTEQKAQHTIAQTLDQGLKCARRGPQLRAACVIDESEPTEILPPNGRS